MEEIWRNISGYKGIYQVSNLGRVRSLDREVYNKGNNTLCKVKGKVLKPNKDKGGYQYTIFYDSVLNFRKTYKIHRLVALYFVDGYEEGLEVNHINGIRDDNRSENLEWCTRSHNIRDTFKRGRVAHSEHNNSSKLQNRDVGVIASLYDSGVSQSIIAKAFGVSQTTISNVINNKHYKNSNIEKGLAINLNEVK